MKRRKPSQARSENTVNAIIQALARIIEADGYPSANTAKIAKEAGVGVATVYGYFENKEDIFISLLERQSNEALQLLTDGLPAWGREERDVAVRSFIQFLVTEVTKRAAITKTLMIHTPHLLSNPKTARLVGQFEIVLGLIFKIPGSIPGEKGNADSFIVFSAFMGLIRGIANGLPANVTPDDVVERLEAIVSKFLEAD